MTGNTTSARSGPQRPGRTLSPRAWRNTASAAGQGDAPARQGTRAAGRKPFAAAGAAAAAVPAVPGAAFAAAGHPGGMLLLICSGVIGLVSVIAGAVVKIYDSAQQTRRLQIQHAGTTAIATALAKCIDDAHAAARDVPARQRAAEAASVRASAIQVAAEMMPAALAVIGQQCAALDDLDAQDGHRHRDSSVPATRRHQALG